MNDALLERLALHSQGRDADWHHTTGVLINDTIAHIHSQNRRNAELEAENKALRDCAQTAINIIGTQLGRGGPVGNTGRILTDIAEALENNR